MNKGYQNFKKKAGKLAIALTLVGSTAIGASAATTTGVTKASVNMRTGAGTKYKVITKLKADKTVRILGEKGNWYKIKYNGKTGYVSKSYVIKKNYTVEQYSGKYITKTSLNVRKGPGTSYLSAGKLAKGTVVDVIGKASNGWLQIKYNGATRYISGLSKYVEKYTEPVEENNAPTISVEDTYTMTKGDDFDYAMLKATAQDKEDGDLTSKIDFSGVVNTGKVGEYTVKLTVKDSKGETATKTVKVIVKDKVVENNAPVINVEETYTLTKGDDFDFSMLKATAQDKEDGDLTSKIDFSGYVNSGKVGEYTVKLTVKDSKGETATKTVKVIVKEKEAENNAPTISVADTYTLTKGDDFDYAMLKATAQDKEDGDLTSKIDFSGYVNSGKVGQYTIKLTVKDSKGETATKTVKVIVEDVKSNNKPVIAVDSTYEVKQNRSFSYNDLKASAFDEEDGKVDIVYTGKVDTKTLGEYEVVLTATDKDGNKAVKVVTVKVVRNVAPVINCAYAGKEYKVEVNKSFSLSDLKATASDFEDGDLTNQINYTVKDSAGKVLSSVDTTKVDKYTVTLTVVDSDGAKATQDITVSVVNDVPPTIAFYDKDGKVTTKDTYTIEQGDKLDTSDAGMKAIFNPKADDGNGGDITSKINVIGNDKIDVNKDGTYTVKFQVTDNKDAYVKDAKIVVLKNNAPKITVKNNVNIKLNDTFDYSLLGAKAEDKNAVDGTITPCEVTYKGSVDTSTVGVYTITVSAKDAKGLESVKKVYVNVKEYKDNTAPVISYGEGSLVKNDTLEVKFGTDLGKNQASQQSKLKDMIKAVATDDKDGVITDQIVYNLSEKINTNAIGNEYKLTLTVTDSGDTNNENLMTATKVITIKVVK